MHTAVGHAFTSRKWLLLLWIINIHIDQLFWSFTSVCVYRCFVIHLSGETITSDLLLRGRYVHLSTETESAAASGTLTSEPFLAARHIWLI